MSTGIGQELTPTARFSSRPTCSHSNQLLRDATSTVSSGSEAPGGSPSASCPGSSLVIAATTSYGPMAPRRPPVRECPFVMPEEAALHADVNWYGVLAHHARAMPDKAIAIFESKSVS